MTYYISKRAVLEEAAAQWLKTVFDPNAGPFENFFRMLSFAAPFTGLGLWRSLVVLAATKLLGISPIELGKWLDDRISKDTVANWFRSPPDQPPPEFQQALSQLLKKSGRRIDLHKQASIFSILRTSGGFIHTLWKALQKVMVFIAGTFMVANLHDLYGKVEKDIGSDLLGKLKLPEKFKEPGSPKPAMEGKKDVDTMIDELKKKYNI